MTNTLNNQEALAASLDDYFTPREVADLLKFRTTRPVCKAIKAGDLAAYEVFRQFRIEREDLLSWMNRNRLGVDSLADPVELTTPAKRKGGRSAASVVAEAMR
jgi:excisionase family DNA binding protein